MRNHSYEAITKHRIKQALATLLLYVLSTMIHAQTVSHTTRYDEQWGMAQWHITKMLQDRKGFMWFSTWNGLTRFDGYEYVTFKTHAGDGCPVTTDRIRDIELAPNGNIYCMFDEVWYLFNRQTGRFSPLPNALNKQLINKHTSPKPYNNRKTLDGENVKRQMRDRQGNLWTLTEQAIIKQTSYHTPCQSFALSKPAQARCFMVERDAHHYWVATKDDKALRRYSADNRLDGYLTPQGMLSTTPTMFSSAVYTMCQLKDGSILLGSKPDGIFHLTPQDHAQSYQINKITLGSEKANSIYDIRQDHDGRIWIATFHGIFYMNHSGDTPKSIQQTAAWRVRYIHLSRDGKAMMVATTTGLAIAPMPQKGKESQMRFTLHSREPNRAESLSNSATMDICETDNGRIFVSTESGGINEFSIRQRFDHSINFKHYDMMSGFDSDVALSLTIVGKKLLVVGGNVISTLDLQSGMVTNYGKAFFHQAHQYSDAHPTLLPDGRWLFGMQDGAFTIASTDLDTRGYIPPLVITGIQIERQRRELCVDHLQAISLNKHQRTITITFSALDLRAPEDIKYAFRLHPDDEWTIIGNTHTLTLPDMKPGDYVLQLRSTNADGTWVDNMRSLNVHITPQFTETIWAQVIGFILLLAIILGSVYAVVTIRRTRRKQRETLAAYLALLDHHTAASPSTHNANSSETANNIATQPVNEEDERLKRLIMQFVEVNIGNSETSIEDMASAVAMSRSGLSRKMKKLTGLSPAEFLREARIKHACRLLRETTRNVSEVAYACGFSDPKYFGKTFKQLVGSSPSEYRANR